MSTNLVRQMFSAKMLITLAMGFSSGLPLVLIGSTLQAWMSDAGVDLGKIGLIALVGIPYNWKFLWAPIFDRYTLPFLGRRRGWMLVVQVVLALAIIAIGLGNPAVQLLPLAIVALLTAFFSATQDIVIDAYRREHLEDSELALGSTVYTYGYRIAMVIASSVALIVADVWGWKATYFLMGLCMVVGMVTTLLAPEPEVTVPPPKSLKESVWGPFREFFSRPSPWWILAFILLYKLGDSMASAITIPFYLETGFTKTEIGVIVKGAGLMAILVGMGLGGALVLRLGIWHSLWFFGVLQGLSTAGFALLHWYGPSSALLSGVIAFENVASGMGTAAYMAYMASQSNKRFTATQFALFTSLMSNSRTLFSAPAGYIAAAMGWDWFFIFCALVAIPGLLLLGRLKETGSG